MVRVVPQRDRTSIPDEHSRDTVSSVGVRKTQNFPSTDTCDHVCYFRQALALDERRVRFLPEYVYGGMRSDWHKYQVPAPPPTDEGRIKEVWFAGSHSDVYVSPASDGTHLIICF